MQKARWFPAGLLFCAWFLLRDLRCTASVPERHMFRAALGLAIALFAWSPATFVSYVDMPAFAAAKADIAAQHADAKLLQIAVFKSPK
jgi:hypothetical protein